MRRAVILLSLLAGAACAGGDPTGVTPRATSSSTTESPATSSITSTTTATTSTTSTAAATTRPPTTRAPRPTTAVVEVTYRIEVRTSDPVGADFPGIVESTLTDARGWQRARFRLLRREGAEYAVVLAEPADAQELCKP